MTRDVASQFVQHHVIAPVVQRVTQALSSSSSASPRPPDTPTLSSVSACFELARATANVVISAVTSKLLASMTTSDHRSRHAPAAAVNNASIRVETAADLAARDEIARLVVDTVVAAAIDSTPSRRHHQHQHHMSNKQPLHLSLARELARHVYLSDILPTASDRAVSSKRKRRRPPSRPSSGKSEGDALDQPKQGPIHADAAPPPPEPSINAERLRQVAVSLVATATTAAIHSVMAIATPVATTSVPDVEPAAQVVTGDDTEAAPAPEVVARTVDGTETTVQAAPSPVPAPAAITKPSPPRKRQTSRAKDKTKYAPPDIAVDSSVPPPASPPASSLLPPIKLPLPPRNGSGGGIVGREQPTPRTARTAAAAIGSPRESPSPRPALLLPSVVTTPRSSTSHASLAAIYQPPAPKPPPPPMASSSSKPPRHLMHSRQQPFEQPPAESPLSPTDKSKASRRHHKGKSDKAKTPSGYCQRCVLEGRACKLRDCLKHQPPLRLPPARRAHQTDR